MEIDASRGTFEEILSASSPQVAAIAKRLRERIAELSPQVTEVPRPAEQHADYSLEPKRQSESFAYLCPLKDYVRLGFYYGGALPDPARLLVGEGKRLRHIKIYMLAEAERPEIGDLLRAAMKERQQAREG